MYWVTELKLLTYSHQGIREYFDNIYAYPLMEVYDGLCVSLSDQIDYGRIYEYHFIKN